MKKWVLGVFLGFLFSSYCSHKENSKEQAYKMGTQKSRLKSSPEISRIKSLDVRISDQLRYEENFPANNEELLKWRSQQGK